MLAKRSGVDRKSLASKDAEAQASSGRSSRNFPLLHCPMQIMRDAPNFLGVLTLVGQSSGAITLAH